MSATGRRLLVTGIVGVSYLGWAIGLVLAYRVEVVVGGDVARFADTALFSLAWIGFPVVGALLALRRPDTPVGWAVLLVGFSMYAFEPLTWTDLIIARGDVPSALLLWGSSLANALAVVPILGFTLLLLAFPDGWCTRWARGLAALATGATALVTGVRLLRPGRLDTGVELHNPFGVTWMPGGEELVGPLTAIVVATAVVALLRLGVRYRRAGSVERKQLQWVLASVTTFPVVWMLGNAVEEVNYWVGQYMAVAAFVLAFLGFTVALYRAITRQNLYGIDRVVSRTVTYAVVLAVLAVTYLGGVVGLGAVARAMTGESGEIVVALSTLAVAAAFQPVRRRVQRAVDRRFDRTRYDASRVVDAFGRDLRDELGLEAVCAQFRAVAGATFQPEVVGLVLVGFDDRGVRE